jgi:hypothetical protein
MVAEHFRRELKGEVAPLKPDPPIEVNGREIPFIVEIQPDGRYAEIVKIKDILGRKPRQRSKKKPDQQM